MNQQAIQKKPYNEVDKFKPLLQTLTKYSEQIKLALPKGTIDPNRILRMFISQVRKVPQLAACDPVTVVGAVVRVAQLGIDPERAYLIPYGKECNVIIDYRGLCDLVRRHPDMEDVYAYAVYEHDKFEIELGSHPKLAHVPNVKVSEEERGEPILYYAVGRFANGFSRFEYMTRKDVEKHRDKHCQGKSPAWQKSFDEMAKKTVLRKITKTLPTTSEVAQVEVMDSGSEESQHNHMVIDAEHTPEHNKSADATTMKAIADEGSQFEQDNNKTQLINAVVERVSELVTQHGAEKSKVEETIGCPLKDLTKMTQEQLANMLEVLA